MRLTKLLALTIFASSTLAACGPPEAGLSRVPIPISILTPISTPIPTPTATPYPSTIIFEEKTRLGIGPVRQSVVSHAGDRIALATSISVNIYDLESKTMQYSWDIPAGSIEHMAWSPDGERLALGSDSGVIYIRDLRNNQHAQVISAHSSEVQSIAWTPDGASIASIGADSYLRVWNLESSKRLLDFKLSGWHLDPSISWSQDGAQLKILDSSTFIIWDKTSGEFSPGNGPGFIPLYFPPMFSADGSQIIYSYGRYHTNIWDIEKGEDIRTAQWLSDDYPEKVFLSPNGTAFVSVTDEGEATIIDFTSLALPLDLPWNGVTEIDWLPGVKTMLVNLDDRPLMIWADGASSQFPIPQGHTHSVESIVWSPDGSQIATADTSGKAILWDLSTGTSVTSLELFILSTAAWSPDHTQIIVVDTEDAVRLMDVQSGDIITWQHLAPQNISSVSWSPDGDQYAVIDDEGTIILVEQESGETTLLREGNASRGLDLAWSPDGTKLAASKGIVVYIWDMATLSVIKSLGVGNLGASKLTWSPSGTRLAGIRHEGNQVRVWDVTAPDYKVLFKENSAFAIAWSPYERMLALYDKQQGLVIYDTVTWRPIQILNTGKSEIENIAWSPDGSMFATADREGRIRIWGLKSP